MQTNNYHETWQRGTLDFSVEYHYVTLLHPRFKMMPHWHTETELLRVLSGKIVLHMNEQTLELEKNDCVYIPSGCVHFAYPEEDCIYECLVMDLSFLMNKNETFRQQLQNLLQLRITPTALLSRKDPSLSATLQTLFDDASHLRQSRNRETLVISDLYRLIGEIFCCEAYSPTTPLSPRFQRQISCLKDILDYIAENYSHPITLTELANSASLSPRYLCRFFKKMTHQTPFDYLNLFRIEKACLELLLTDASVTEIAYRNGFNDLSHFNRLFRRYKGESPTTYRNH